MLLRLGQNYEIIIAIPTKWCTGVLILWLTKWCIRQTKINQVVYTTLHVKQAYQECSDLYFSRVLLNGTLARHDRIIRMLKNDKKKAKKDLCAAKRLVWGLHLSQKFYQALREHSSAVNDHQIH